MRAAGGIFKGPDVTAVECRLRRIRISPAPLQLHPQFLAAVKASLPVLPGVLAFGAISGVAMVAAGMPHYLAMAMSVLVYAGSSQLAAVRLIIRAPGKQAGKPHEYWLPGRFVNQGTKRDILAGSEEGEDARGCW
jgi:hypothetical protein